MPREPPVPISPQARLLARLRPGLMPSVETFLQSHSSSSATSWARPVIVPWPISERATRITQESSGLIATQMLTSLAPFSAATSVMPGTLKPSTRPPPAIATEPTTNLRRESFGVLSIVFVMASSSRLAISGARLPAVAGREMHGFADALVGPAAADVGHRRVDIGVGRLRLLLQQRDGGHDLARLAVAALRHIDRRPGFLHRMRGVGREALDGDDLVGRLHGAERDRAGALHFAVDVHRAGAALRDAAAVFGAGEACLLADDPEQRRVRLGLHIAHFAVDVEFGHVRSSQVSRGHSSRAAVFDNRGTPPAMSSPPPAWRAA